MILSHDPYLTKRYIDKVNPDQNDLYYSTCYNEEMEEEIESRALGVWDLNTKTSVITRYGDCDDANKTTCSIKN